VESENTAKALNSLLSN